MFPVRAFFKCLKVLGLILIFIKYHYFFELEFTTSEFVSTFLFVNYVIHISMKGIENDYYLIRDLDDKQFEVIGNDYKNLI